MTSDTNIINRREALSFEAPRRAHIEGVDLAYGDSGSGPVVMGLHAVGHGSRDFEHIKTRLPHYRWVLPDWPGHGRSGPDHEPMSAARCEALVSGLLDHLGVRSAVLVGNSIGGAAALRYTVAHPERVRALVLCNAGGLAAPGRLVRWFCHGMARAYRGGMRGARWYRLFFRLQYHVLLRGPAAKAQRQRIVAAGDEMAPVLEQAWRSFASDDADVRHLASQVRCPVFLGWARSDPYNSHRLVGKTLKRFPRGELRLYRGAHVPFLEAPDAFAADFERFLFSRANGP